MQWEINLVTSVTILTLLNGPQVKGISQENSYVIECIRDLVPIQVYSECCTRENNCTISRQQNRAIDCMSRIIMNNYTSHYSSSRENGPGTTGMGYSYNRNHEWYGDLLDTIGESCSGLPRTRQQTCIRNELIKRCRYSMLQDRITSAPTRWNERRIDVGYGYHDNHGRFGPNRPVGSRRFSNRHNNHDYLGRPTDYSSDTRFYSSRGGYGEEMDEEDIGYSDGDTIRFK